jgi:hypothetical protein
MVRFGPFRLIILHDRLRLCMQTDRTIVNNACTKRFNSRSVTTRSVGLSPRLTCALLLVTIRYPIFFLLGPMFCCPDMNVGARMVCSMLPEYTYLVS